MMTEREKHKWWKNQPEREITAEEKTELDKSLSELFMTHEDTPDMLVFSTPEEKQAFLAELDEANKLI